MEQAHVYELAKQLEHEIVGILSHIDTSELDSKPGLLVRKIKAQVIDIRLDARDIEYAETKSDWMMLGREVTARLELLRQAILAASEYGIFNAVDVVHFSTRLDSLLDTLA